MPAGGKPTVRSRRLGAALKRLRLASQLDQDRAADAVDCSVAKISRIESGQVSARVGDVRVLLDLYGVQDGAERGRLEKLARDSNKRGWWLDYRTPTLTQLGDFIALEADATYIRSWQPVFIPGVLQTPAYTRALIAANPAVITAEAADEIVKVRQQRREAIQETGARFAAVIWEPALTAPMPSSEAHSAQLAHIAEISRQQNVTIQVLPLDEWAAARVATPFVTFAFGPEPAPEAVAFDSLSNTVILEDSDELVNYAHAFDTLRSAALTPDKSRAFIEKTIKSIPREGRNP
ncbi:helix-turn-helix domain-containing protein [Streptomyces xinghaiensis]|uniref:helix-turn-helix domain-containing protein n=1 Tax=Streptomyces xinghaiensis TaxID=1038928 RepID=UPI000585AA74|nr:helix-turn-helix transcriptional regulator [Streptomyces xinghaiensis]MZE77621.1 helix-turn-helix domain-containing protein [Streptomyces sp. SID5475]